MAGDSTVHLRPADRRDADVVAQVYNHYVLNSIATFEEQPVSSKTMAERIQAAITRGLPWLVAEMNGQLAGYAYASPWKLRSAYRHAVEITVYIGWEFLQQGLGTQLYQALFAQLSATNVHTVVAGIALPNPACVALHEKFGLSKVAHFREIGFKFEQRLDVGYWQKTL